MFYTTLKMLDSVEGSFNEIWGVLRSRTLMRKFSDYLAILVVTPLVLLVGTAFTGFLSSNRALYSLFGEIDVEKPLLAALPLAPWASAAALRQAVE